MRWNVYIAAAVLRVCVCDLTRSPSAADIPGYHNRGWAGHLSHSCRCIPERPPSAGLGPRWSSAGTAAEGKTNVCVFISTCIKARLTLLVHLCSGAAFFFPFCVHWCSVCFGDLSLATSGQGHKYNIYGSGMQPGPWRGANSQTDDCRAHIGRPSVTSPPCLDAYVRLGVLEDEEWQGEVVLGQADHILFEQRFGCTFSLSLTPVQEWNHPLEGVLHVALGPGLMRNKHS